LKKIEDIFPQTFSLPASSYTFPRRKKERSIKAILCISVAEMLLMTRRGALIGSLMTSLITNTGKENPVLLSQVAHLF
jgi:hypothetical protein